MIVQGEIHIKPLSLFYYIKKQDTKKKKKHSNHQNYKKLEMVDEKVLCILLVSRGLAYPWTALKTFHGRGYKG